MRDRVAEMEYVFCDTEKELPETYEFLNKLEAYLGRPIVRLKADRGFDHYLKDVYRGYLPSPQMRWCTRQLKIIPFERYVGNDNVINYIGIRADEDREGYISSKPNIRAAYPFKEHGVRREDVLKILEEAGLGLPSYYAWRSRSGCYFCFFQRKREWVGLLRNHPELFEAAKSYEKPVQSDGPGYTWQRGESLDELSNPIRVESIVKQERPIGKRSETLADILRNDLPDDEERACLICDL